MKTQRRPSAAGIDLCDVLPKGRWLAGRGPRITSCSCDSRDCRSGDLFAAIVGSEHDGHHFVDEAISRGAAAVLAERPVPEIGVPIYLVDDAREALGRVCHTLVGNPSDRLPVIGVTGTNGKTTTSCLLSSIFRAAGARAALSGTLGCCDGFRTRPAPLTTPGAATLANWLARSEAKGCSHAVLEVSSHALAQRRTAGITFDAACVTNVRHDHVDFHGSLENYRRAKARLFSQLREGGAVALCQDDPVCRSFLSELDGPVLTFGFDPEANVSASVIERCRSEQTFMLTAGDVMVPVRTRIIGDHHVANCLAAAALGLLYGIDLATIAHGLERVDRMPGRLERIECGQSFSVFVDYAHTPDALETVLQSLRAICEGRLICVFGAGGERDRTKRPLMGRTVELGTDLAIVTDDNPRRESPERIVRDILRGFERSQEVAIIPDRRTAIHTALAMAAPGDCVLIAGKGHETHQQIGRREFPFDDREVAREWLYGAPDWPVAAALGRAA